jgi:hypothetical protein
MSNSLVAAAEQAHTVLVGSQLPHRRGAHGVPDVTSLGDEQLRDAIVAIERLVNSAQALQAIAIAEIGRRAREADELELARVGFHGPHSAEEIIVDELALLLSCTKNAATYAYERAVRSERSASVMTAWIAGRIDGRKAQSIADTYARCGESLPEDALSSMIDSAIDYASQRTGPQLREWLRRREVSVDPGLAEQRRQRALSERRVSISPADDGMSHLWALLPDLQARQVQQVLNQVALEAGSGDVRTMDQRRADALVELITGEADPPDVLLHVVVPHDTLTGETNRPGWAPGVGPVTAEQVRELTCADEPRGTRRLLTDPSTGILTDITEARYRPSRALDQAVRYRDLTCRFPGCRRSALGTHSGTDLDHTTPWPQGETAAHNLAVLCRRHHRLKHSPGWQVTLNGDCTMTWTTPTGRSYTSDPWQYDDPDPPALE